MSRTALVVDDSPSMLQMTAFTLEKAGFTVLKAQDGQAALAQVAGSRPDLVVTDLNMPRMDGLTLIRHLRALPQHRFTPILMLTTESQESRKQEGRAAGATGWVVKPFDPEQLLKAISRIVR